MKNLTIRTHILVIKLTCLLAGAMLVSCAFGDEDAIKSLFQENEDPLIIAIGGDAGGGAIYASINGKDWLGNLYPYPSGPFYQLNHAAYGAERFISVGANGALGVALISKDGLLWTGAAQFSSQMWGIAFYKNKFIAVGNNAIYVSEDGLMWLGPTNLNGEILKDTAIGNGRIVVVGYANFIPYPGRVYVSDDGVVWYGPISIDSFNNLVKVVYGKDRFVAVGENGRVAISTDGLAWSVQQTPSAVNFTGIAYGNGLFVATNMNFEFFVSIDGIAWTRLNQTAPSIMQDVNFCNGRFIAVGFIGYIFTSVDGFSWQQSQLGAQPFYGVTCRP